MQILQMLTNDGSDGDADADGSGPILIQTSCGSNIFYPTWSLHVHKPTSGGVR
jgi:hypothetical protein